MRPDHMRSDAGFTLLEVLVAFIIAALALAVLFDGAVGGLRSARLSAHYQEALSRARSRLAAVVPTDADQQGDDGGGFHWHTQVTTLAAAPGSVLHGIRVVISWDSDGGTRDVALSSEYAAQR